MKKVLITLSIIILLGAGIYGLKTWTKNKIISFDTLDFSLPRSYAQESFTPIEPISVTHLQTPEPVKAIYISSWVAGTPKRLNSLIEFIDASEINAVVFDIKDATGRVSFPVEDPIVAATESPTERIANIEEIINLLHMKNIYVIGRISVFQDPYLTKIKPEWAVTKQSDETVWKDYKGLSFLDPANQNVWEYVVALARTSYNKGFDEINFDYIRYPSDGNIRDIDYKLGEGKVRSDHLKDFFAFLAENLYASHPAQTTSADLFGLTTTAYDDLGIGQVWEIALPYFDYLAPMIYPSHYGHGFFGIANPEEKPYETIKYALEGAIAKTEAAGFSKTKIRPWLQDFSLKTTYDSEKIQAQIKAVNDVGLTSWMMWDPGNSYTTEAYQVEESVIQ